VPSPISCGWDCSPQSQPVPAFGYRLQSPVLPVLDRIWLGSGKFTKNGSNAGRNGRQIAYPTVILLFLIKFKHI
jgi:hypothetical protein